MNLQKILGIRHPIIQAPMAGVQGSELAVAVCNAGGLGSLPGAMLSVDALRKELTIIRDGTTQPYNVNFFSHSTPVFNSQHETVWRAALKPYFIELGVDVNTIPEGPSRLPFSHETVEVLGEFEPSVVSFHFGLPSAALLMRLRSWDAKILSTATTIEEARWLERHGVDAIIAQGLEAGGHRGNFLSDDLKTQTSTNTLVAQIVSAVNIPVIAAGGIINSQDIAAAMARGASGVQVGTAYLLCPEATTSEVHRAALKSSSAKVTAITNLFSGRPARGIVNRLMEELGPINSDVPAFPLAASLVSVLRTKAENQGSGDFSPLWAGKNASGCKEIPAAVLTKELTNGLEGFG
ncbi:MAG: nitronate monooxygenase [Arenicella sp.]